MTANLPVLNNVETIVRFRELALETYAEAGQLLDVALAKVREARDFEKNAHFGTHPSQFDEKIRSLTALSIPETGMWIDANRKMMDLSIWTYLLDKSGLKHIMDAQAVKEFRESLVEYHPEATEDAIRATFDQKFAESGMMFNRGIMNTFSKLDRRFKSHDGFKIGSRVILDYFCDQYGSINYNASRRETLIDIDRVFAVLNGDAPEGYNLISQLENERRELKQWGSGFQSEHEFRYFRIRIYKNGNAHLWFTNDDLVRKVNKHLAELYGEVLPDGATKEDAVKAKTGTAVSKDLQFYATPVEAASEILKKAFDYHAKEGMRILEPSAGEGAIVLAAKRFFKNCTIDAIEFDPARVNVLKAQNIADRVYQGNFFNHEPAPKYDAVIMNPPFYGTHYMEHVYHAFQFLKPGGRLVAILPVTAELGDSKAHAKFQKFVEENRADQWGNRCYFDLPEGTFAGSGTNINTVYINLVRK